MKLWPSCACSLNIFYFTTCNGITDFKIYVTLVEFHRKKKKHVNFYCETFCFFSHITAEHSLFRMFLFNFCTFIVPFVRPSSSSNFLINFESDKFIQWPISSSLDILFFTLDIKDFNITNISKKGEISTVRQNTSTSHSRPT